MKKIAHIFIILIFIWTISCKNNNSPSKQIHKITFNQDESKLNCELIFPNHKTNTSLIKLNEKYRLNLMITDSKNDIDKAFILMDWTHNQWKHNGNNNSKESNALNILERANNGERFRCVEYGIVLSATLNSISIPTRTLGLKTKDVETTKYGAGHVVSEAYIPDLKKWVFMDPQINYIPYLNGIPLNAVEYQKAIIENKQAIELRNHNGVIDKEKAFGQINWIGKYLYYFDVSFDSSKNRINCHKKNKLMLVPINAKEPTVFQINSKMTNYLYTNNLNDFYKEPKIL